MDKGLDIALLPLCAVAHAALHLRPARLRTVIDALRQSPTPLAGEKLLQRLAATSGFELSWQTAASTRRWLEASPQHALLCIDDPGYPPLLAEIPDPPPLLFVTGDPGLLSAPQLAVVGSRRATAAGRDIAVELSRQLAAAGWTVTSGLASGIDAAAHRGALDAAGMTLAVFGCGVDRIYPATNAGLAREIAQRGALVSEFPLGAPPTRYTFPRRNRLISGLSRGVLVIEAAEGSGSLITAQQALEQGREVFAVPGSIRNPLSRGCHALLRQGAVLVETVEDVLGEFPGSGLTARAAEHRGQCLDPLAPEERRVLEALEYEPVVFDEVVDRCGLTAPEVSSILTALEIAGHVRAESGGRFLRALQFPD